MKELSIHSIMGEDYLVMNTFFKSVVKVFFVMLGVPSNIPEDTYAFEKKGWSGYAFEPLPEMENLWLKNRKADFYPYAILDEDKELIFSIRQKGKAWEKSLSNIFGKKYSF